MCFPHSGEKAQCLTHNGNPCPTHIRPGHLRQVHFLLPVPTMWSYILSHRSSKRWWMAFMAHDVVNGMFPIASPARLFLTIIIIIVFSTSASASTSGQVVVGCIIVFESIKRSAIFSTFNHFQSRSASAGLGPALLGRVPRAGEGSSGSRAPGWVARGMVGGAAPHHVQIRVEHWTCGPEPGAEGRNADSGMPDGH